MKYACRSKRIMHPSLNFLKDSIVPLSVEALSEAIEIYEILMTAE